MALINTNNLNESSLTNAEVIALLKIISGKVYEASYSTILDAIEDLTGNRNFDELSEIEEAEKSLKLKNAKATVIAKF